MAFFPVFASMDMESTEEKKSVRYDNLVASPRGLAEAHGKKIMIFVPAEGIDRIVLKFGRSDHRPKLSLTCGILLVFVGIFGVFEFFQNVRGYRYDLGMLAFGIIGGSMIFDTLKQRYFFEVDTHRRNYRLVFSKKARKEDIDQFCQEVTNTYRYSISEAV